MSPIQFPSKRMNDCFTWEFNGTKNSFSAMMIAWTFDKILYIVQHTQKLTICGLESFHLVFGIFLVECAKMYPTHHIYASIVILLHMTEHLRKTFSHFMIKIFNFLCSSTLVQICLKETIHAAHTNKHISQLYFIFYTLICCWVIVKFKYAETSKCSVWKPFNFLYMWNSFSSCYIFRIV